MKIALVCDWLTTPGGAEKVLLELHRMYPKAPIYTSQYRKKGISWFANADVRTGWLQFFPAGLRKFLGPLRQLYFSRLNLTDYDLVISVTGAEAKSVRAKTHLCYCHAPTQYYWHLYDRYLENPGFGFLNPLVRFFFKLLVRPLRDADYRAAQKPTQFITISTYAAAQIQKYYHRTSTIIAPPVEIHSFSTKKSTKTADFSTKNRELSTTFPHTFPQDAQPFVIACRQVTWKRIDLAIKACLKTKQPLLVIGNGPEHQRLVKLAGSSPLVAFIPWLTPPELAYYLQNSKAYIFPSLEPFGIAAVEALAAGCPVIAYAEGGSRDFIHERGPSKNGLLFAEQTVVSLASALQSFDPAAFNPTVIKNSTAPFAPEVFRQKITSLVAETTKPSASRPPRKGAND